MVKRAFDIVFSATVLVMLAPLMAAIAMLIKLGSHGPVFYCGERVGLAGKRFRIFKFRTMAVNADKIGGSSTPEDDPRITRIGRFLRKHKLDELPQFLNVLMGDMSMVGPRPQVAWAVDLYTEEEKALLSVRPGITDYASIKFHNEGEILRGSPDPDQFYLEHLAPEKTRLGLVYVRNHSLPIDCWIILMTLLRLFIKDHYEVTHGTADDRS